MAGREVSKYNESKKKDKERYFFIINLTENELGALGKNYKYFKTFRMPEYWKSLRANK